MSSTTFASLAVAACAVLGCVGAVLALAFRVGRLVGTVERSDRAAEGDRVRIWQELGATNSRIERHIESGHGGNRVR